MGRLSRYEQEKLKQEQMEFRGNRARRRNELSMQVNRFYMAGLGIPETAKNIGCTEKVVEAHRRWLGLSSRRDVPDLRGHRLSTRTGVDILLDHEAAAAP